MGESPWRFDSSRPHSRIRPLRCLRRAQTGARPAAVPTRAGGWIGWVELKTETVNELAMEHTAMVMRDVNADVMGVVEAETRIALNRFSSQLLDKVNGVPYAHVMVIDGNEDRGIDVGVMTRAGYEITSIYSHVDDQDEVGTVFSRDCPEYLLRTPTGARLVVLVNHLKSKGFGSTDDSNRKRKRQATKVKEIYERLVASGEQNVVVLGDFNDTPDSHVLDRHSSDRPARGLRAEGYNGRFPSVERRGAAYLNR